MRQRADAVETAPPAVQLFALEHEPDGLRLLQRQGRHRSAMVRFLMRLPSRMLSRSRMAGLEPRLGTRSIYMRRNLADSQRRNLSHADASTWVHYGAPSGLPC